MKTFYRVFFLICLLVITVFLKMDILSEYIVPTQAQSVCTGDIDADGFQDIVIGHNYNPNIGWGGVSILHNIGWGYFAFTDSLYAYSNEWSVASVNLDSNPKDEILYSIYNPTLDLDRSE